MSNKILIAVGAIVVLAGIGYWGWSSAQPKEQTITTSSGQTIAVPDRMAEINGMVTQIEGNEISILRTISTLSAEEQAAKRAERQAMTVEERQASRGLEEEAAQTENITVVIPVGIPIVIGTGDSSGTLKVSSLEEIKVGGNLSIWQSSTGAVEMVKIKGL
jgi:hypothetical protein